MSGVLGPFLAEHGSMTMGFDATDIFQDYLTDTIKQTSHKISQFFSLTSTLSGPEVLFAFDQLFPTESQGILNETRRLINQPEQLQQPSIHWSFVKKSLHSQTQALDEDAQLAFIAFVNVVIHQVIIGSRKKKTSKRISKQEISKFLFEEKSH